MKILVSMVALAFTSTFVSPALAVTPLPLDRAASIVISIQGAGEEQELQRDLQTDEYQTPPEAAVGNEPPRSWEKAMNQMDCEKARGQWDAPTNKSLEKK